jgi:phosphatidate cytidylyltransferase
MQDALRKRLTFGSLMLAALLAVLALDDRVEHWTRGWVTAPSGHFGLGGVGLFLLLMTLLPLAVTEVATLFSTQMVRPYRFIAALGSGAMVLHAFLTQFGWFQHVAASTLAFIIVMTMVLAAARRAWGKQSQDAILHMAGTLLATLYLGGLAWFLMALRVKHSMNQTSGFQGSTAAIVMILLVVKFADIGAYFGGSRFGRHKLIPWLSPKKTWEGLFCGLATAAVVGYLCSRVWQRELRMLRPEKALLFGAVIGAVGQLGDLLESLMKRDAQVKDSGKLIPGFGGVLDIIDSPLLAAPVAYLMFSLL